MIVPLKEVRLIDPIDTHDQRNGLVLDAERGFDCALDTEARTILVRHVPKSRPDAEPWEAEFPIERARHWKRDPDGDVDVYRAEVVDREELRERAAQMGPRGQAALAKPKGKKR